MNRKDVQAALHRVREESKTRKFPQTLDMVINFRGLDMKKPESKVEADVVLPHATGKKVEVKVLTFVQDADFGSTLKAKGAKVIMVADIPRLKKKEVDQLLNEYAVFLAEGPAMLEVGKHLGQQLAPQGRMPAPISADATAYEQALKKMSTNTKISNKKGKVMPLVQITVGTEKAKDDELLDNVMAIYEGVVNKLSNKEHNVKSVILKFTMGPAVKVGAPIPQPAPAKPAGRKVEA